MKPSPQNLAFAVTCLVGCLWLADLDYLQNHRPLQPEAAQGFVDRLRGVTRAVYVRPSEDDLSAIGAGALALCIAANIFVVWAGKKPPKRRLRV